MLALSHVSHGGDGLGCHLISALTNNGGRSHFLSPPCTMAGRYFSTLKHISWYVCALAMHPAMCTDPRTRQFRRRILYPCCRVARSPLQDAIQPKKHSIGGPKWARSSITPSHREPSW